MDTICVFFGHDVLDFTEELKFSELIDEVAVDIARENRHRIALNHGLIRHLQLLHSRNFEFVHILVDDLECGVGAAQDSLVDLAHLVIVGHLDHVFDLLVSFDGSHATE